jgi:hypothetical protein
MVESGGAVKLAEKASMGWSSFYCVTSVPERPAAHLFDDPSASAGGLIPAYVFSGNSQSMGRGWPWRDIQHALNNFPYRVFRQV